MLLKGIDDLIIQNMKDTCDYLYSHGYTPTVSKEDAEDRAILTVSYYVINGKKYDWRFYITFFSRRELQFSYADTVEKYIKEHYETTRFARSDDEEDGSAYIAFEIKQEENK